MFKSLYFRRISVIALVAAVIGVVVFVFVIGREVKTQTEEPPEHVCTESDNGEDQFVKGTATFSRNNYDDRCIDTEYLGEFYCKLWPGKTLPILASNSIRCDNGCKDGACLAEPPVEEPQPEECVDSDNGRDYFVKGETADFGDTRKDVCFNSKTLTEFYCEQAEGQSRPSRGAEQKKCDYGCKDGACIEPPSEEELARIEKLKEMIASINGMNNMLKEMSMLERNFKQIAKDGVAMPTDLVQTIAKVKQIRPEIMKFRNKKVEGITNEQAEIFMGNMGEMCQLGLTLEEWSGQLNKYLLLGAKTKRMLNDLKQVKIDVARAVKVAVSSKYGLSDKADELNEAMSALKTTSDGVMASGDLDEKDQKISEFYDQFKNVYDMIWMIHTLQSVGQTVGATQLKNLGIFGEFCSNN